MMVMLVPTSVGQRTLGEHDVDLMPQFISRNRLKGSFCLATMLHTQQPQCQMPSQAYTNYVLVSPQVMFSFRVEPYTNSLCHMLVSVMVFAVCFQLPMWLSCSPMRQHCNLSQYTLVRHLCLLVVVCEPCHECTECLLLHLLQEGRYLMLLIQLSPSHSICVIGHTALGLGRELPNPSTFLHGAEGSSVPCSAPSTDRSNSASLVGIKSGHSSVLIRYQVDECTHIWLAQYFITQSHIYPGFMGKVSTLIHFPLEPLLLFGPGR